MSGEKFLVEDFAELGEPVSQRANVFGFHVVDGLEFVAAFDEFVYFFVLGVDLFFEFALGFDEMLVGGGEVGASCGCPCDGAAYCDAGKSDDGCY